MSNERQIFVTNHLSKICHLNFNIDLEFELWHWTLFFAACSFDSTKIVH
jgi:hypothetical protein